MEFAVYTRMLIDVIGVAIIASLLYAFIYFCNRHNLAIWIARATMEANLMYDDKELLAEKKDFVLKFVYDNGFTAWLPDDVVHYMVDEAFNQSMEETHESSVIENFYKKHFKACEEKFLIR